jgi:predicted porin
MKRKAAALAVGALFAAPAAHAQITFGNEQIGTVQIYGKLYPQIGFFQSDGATQPGAAVSTLVAVSGVQGGSPVNNHGGRFSVDTQNSYIGFRGERALGSTGLKGVWQVEQSVGLDGAGDVWSNRNSFAGLGHKVFGTIKLGNMDTIYKEYGDTMGMFGISSGNFVSASNVLSHIGVGTNGAARFHERKPNSIQYQTGEFGGFQAGIQYVPDENRGDPGRAVNVNTLSYGVKWDSERFYVSLHQERHNDSFGASNNVTAALANGTVVGGVFTPDASAEAKDTATRLSGEFRFLGSQRIVGDIAMLEYKESSALAGTRFRKYEKLNWAIGWDGGFGPWRVATQYIQAGDGDCELSAGVACSTQGLEAFLWTVGVRYRFDRQTFVYAIGALLSMDDAARHDNWANGTPSRGSDVTQLAIGISYSF